MELYIQTNNYDMKITDITAKRNQEPVTNPESQVSAEEFNAIVEAAVAAEKAIGDMKAATTENNLALYPLSMEVGGVANPYESGKDNAIQLTITARHKGKVVTGDVRYLLDGEAVNKQHTITVRESKEMDVRVEYSGYQVLGEVQHLSASKTVKVVCVLPCWIGGSAEASMNGKDLSTMGLQKYLKESPAGEYTIVLNTNGYLWLCVPYEMQIGKVTMSGFDVPVSESLSATPGGEVYRCYRSNELVRGAYTIVVS